MASNDNAGGPAGESLEGSWSPRRPKGKTSAEAASGSDKGAAAPDPEVLAADIERTREDLAETLDAIADKVSPKKVVSRTRKKVGDAVKDGAHEAAEAVKGTAHDAAEAVKGTAHDAAEAVKGGVAAVKAKVGEEDAPRSPLAPPTSVEVDAASPVDAPGSLAGATVPVEPAPTPGALADAAVVPVEPAGAEAPSYPTTLPPPAPSRVPVFAGAVAALAVLLLLRRRRRR